MHVLTSRRVMILGSCAVMIVSSIGNDVAFYDMARKMPVRSLSE